MKILRTTAQNILKSIQSILRRKIDICYNARRQKRIKVFNNKKIKSPRSCSFQGFLLISFFITVDKESSVRTPLFAV